MNTLQELRACGAQVYAEWRHAQRIPAMEWPLFALAVSDPVISAGRARAIVSLTFIYVTGQSSPKISSSITRREFTSRWDQLLRRLDETGTLQQEVLVASMPSVFSLTVMQPDGSIQVVHPYEVCFEIVLMLATVCPVTGEPSAWLVPGYAMFDTRNPRPSQSMNLNEAALNKYKEVRQKIEGVLHTRWLRALPRYREHATNTVVAWDHYTSTGEAV